MKKSFLSAIILSSVTFLSSHAQTWNIPMASTTSVGYIGTTSNHDVNLYANNAARVTVKAAGHVGIGTASPTHKLHVNGDFRALDMLGYTLTLATSEEIPLLLQGSEINLISYASYNDVWYVGLTDASPTAGTSKYSIRPGVFGTGLTIDHSGRVLIGASTWPSNTSCNKLHVAGTIGAQEVNISTTNWCDYVFSPDYKLKSLKEVASFIQTNKHLPEVPSEGEMKENGINVSEIVKIQMKKIEELTLYVIDLEKKIEELSTSRK